jgi:hypothetical protein
VHHQLTGGGYGRQIPEEEDGDGLSTVNEKGGDAPKALEFQGRISEKPPSAGESLLFRLDEEIPNSQLPICAGSSQ